MKIKPFLLLHNLTTKKGSLRRTFTSQATKKLVTKHGYEEFSISMNFAIIVTQSLKAFIHLCINKI